MMPKHSSQTSRILWTPHWEHLSAVAWRTAMESFSTSTHSPVPTSTHNYILSLLQLMLQLISFKIQLLMSVKKFLLNSGSTRFSSPMRESDGILERPRSEETHRDHRVQPPPHTAPPKPQTKQHPRALWAPPAPGHAHHSPGAEPFHNPHLILPRFSSTLLPQVLSPSPELSADLLLLHGAAASPQLLCSRANSLSCSSNTLPSRPVPAFTAPIWTLW